MELPPLGSVVVAQFDCMSVQGHAIWRGFRFKVHKHGALGDPGYFTGVPLGDAALRINDNMIALDPYHFEVLKKD